ncbi:MAG: DUF1385 domain-containing protein [Bacillota bacterium]|nr:DUF1385 domain-containing protein [Bacillota bacterium]
MKKTSIGGSAIFEGLMMIGPENAAIAVRKPDGEIIVEKRELPKKSKLTKVPVIRGVVSFFKQMVLSTKAIMFSVKFIEIESENGNVSPDGTSSNSLKDSAVYLSLLISLSFSVGLFILLPNVMAGLLNFNKNTYSGVIYYNIFEGIIKIGLFFGYLALASKARDIERIWEYHGAEHKTINCYESGEELTVQNVMKFTTKNPRCGTSYMFLVILISILFFSFLGWYAIWLNVVIRLLLIPVVAGISYEVFRYSGKSSSRLARIISMPGLLFQVFTTKEPDETQVEVAITAFNNVTVADIKADEF